MTRIVFIGAGSVEFTRNLLGDILTFPELADATIVLHDIDPERLETAAAMARWTNGAVGGRATIEAHLDRRAALNGADLNGRALNVNEARSAASPPRASTSTSPRSTACARPSATPSGRAPSFAPCARSLSCSTSAATWPSSAPTPGC